MKPSEIHHAVSQQSLLKLWNLRSSFSWQAMREKYLKGVFGTCPRVLCDRHGLRVVYFPDSLGNGKHREEIHDQFDAPSWAPESHHICMSRDQLKNIEERENGSWAEVGLIGDCINGINITSNFYAWFVGLGILHLQFTPLSKHAEHLTAVGCKFREKKRQFCMFFCQGQHTLPMGLAEDLRAAQVKIFCPKCEQADFWQPSRASTTGLACHRSAAGLCCQKQIQRAWRSFFWDVQLSCFQNSFCESMAFHRNFEGVEWLVFFRTSRSSYWNIPSSVESVHILFMPSSDSLAVVSLLHAFHWDFLPQFLKVRCSYSVIREEHKCHKCLAGRSRRSFCKPIQPYFHWRYRG